MELIKGRAKNTAVHGSSRLQKERLFRFSSNTVIQRSSLQFQSLFSHYKYIQQREKKYYVDRDGSSSFCSLLKAISLQLFKLFAPCHLCDNCRNRSSIFKLISRYVHYFLLCAFNTCLQMHFTNFKLIVGTLPGSNYYSCYVRKNMTRSQKIIS